MKTTLGTTLTSFVGLMIAGSLSAAKDPGKTAKDPKGECYGVNSCKGKGECGGPSWDCAGNNTCKGQGWVTKTASECKKLGGKFKADK